MVSFVVPTIYTAVNKVSPTVLGMTRDVSNFASRTEQSMARAEMALRKMTSPLSFAGRKLNNLLGGLGAPVGIAAAGIAAKQTADIFIDFDQANANLAAGLDMTQKQIKPLTDDAKRLGSITKFNAAEVSGLQFEYAKLGFIPQEIQNVTESTLALAAATKYELGPTATLVGSTLRAYGLESNQAGRVTDVLAASVSKTALDMTDLSMNMATFAPVAKAYNFSLEESVALFGKIKDSGFDASSAATALRNIFLNMADGNGLLARALGKPAHNIEELTDGMITLRNKGVDLAQMLELTDKRSVAAFATLLDNAEGAKKLSAELENARGFSKKMADTQLNTVAGTFTIMKAAWEGLVLSIEDGTGKIAQKMRTFGEVSTDILRIASGTAAATSELSTHGLEIRRMAENAISWGKTIATAALALGALKVALIAGRIALTGINIAIGVTNALFTTSTVLTYQNVAAQKSYLITSKIVGGALNILAGDFTALNAAMAANPAGMILLGVTALAGGIWYLNHRSEELTEEWERQRDLDIASTYDRSRKSVDELSQTYQKLGFNIQEATIKAVEQKFVMANMAVQEAQANKSKKEQELTDAYDNALFPAFSSDVSRKQNEKDDANAALTNAMAGRSGATSNIQQLLQSGGLSLEQANNILNGIPLSGFHMNAPQLKTNQSPQFNQQQQGVISEMNKGIAGGLTITVKNDSNLPVAVGQAGRRLIDVQPKATSTTELDKK